LYQNNHISKKDLLNFHNDKMNPKEKLIFLKHISSCDFCAEQFAKSMENELITAPIDMKSSLLNKTAKISVHITKKAKNVSKHIKLLWYSLKVCSAAMGALAVLLLIIKITAIPPVLDREFRTPKNTYFAKTASMTSAIRNNMNNLTNQMLDFSNNIMYTEVDHND
jgi:hypothetical protein